MYQNKKVFILGMARSGYAAAKVLAKQNCQITIVDSKDQDEAKVKELETLGIIFIKTDKPEVLLDNTYDYVVKNPGISYKHPCIIRALELKIKVINEVEVAYNLLPKNVKIIGITGSNGKTTTTTLIYEMLKEAGLNVHLGGNIGIPFCDLLIDIKENDILVLEISAHQLHDFENFKTDISVLTNLYEVHLDFFDNFDNYKQNKKVIFNHHNNKSIAVLNIDNDDVLVLTDDIVSNKKYFSSTKQNADAFIKDNNIYYNKEKIIELSDIRLKGVHNYENVMCAIMVVKEFNVKDNIIYKVLNNFKGVEHRIEFVKEINKRTFYNDSKSTNTTATITALKSFSTPIILILGGLDRNHSFDELIPYMNDVKLIICYGETKDRIKEFASQNNIECQVVNTLKEATEMAYKLSKEGDTILLSPACASWDQYDSFEVRGIEFKKIINNLKGE